MRSTRAAASEVNRRPMAGDADAAGSIRCQKRDAGPGLGEHRVDHEGRVRDAVHDRIEQVGVRGARELARVERPGLRSPARERRRQEGRDLRHAGIAVREHDERRAPLERLGIQDPCGPGSRFRGPRDTRRRSDASAPRSSPRSCRNRGACSRPRTDQVEPDRGRQPRWLPSTGRPARRRPRGSDGGGQPRGQPLVVVLLACVGRMTISGLGFVNCCRRCWASTASPSGSPARDSCTTKA